MKRRTKLFPLFAVALVFIAACAGAPRPSVLSELDAIRAAPTSSDAKKHAPSAFAHAEKLRREALAMLETEDLPGVQMLGERAVAAYAHAHALARIARAEDASVESAHLLSVVQGELASLEGEQARAMSEVEALELRIKVIRDAQAIVPAGPASAEREMARLGAARALSLQARLLCSAARLLVNDASPADKNVLADLDTASTAVGKLEADLKAAPRKAPIDDATRARAACLAVLSRARRAATSVSRAPGVGDELLAALSARGDLAPLRDDRGVIVTLRGLFSGNALTPAAEKRVAELGRIARAHPTFPALVVMHQDKEPPRVGDPAAQARAESVAKAMREAGAPEVVAIVAGAASPVVDPRGKDRARNARVEIVFVTPESF